KATHLGRSVKKGDCFTGDLCFKGNPHYWIVLRDPDAKGRVAIVNCTTGCGFSKAQKIKQAECPALQYDSELAWGESLIVIAAGLDKAIAEKKFTACVPTVAGAADRILGEGLAKKLVPKEIAKFLQLGY
ncbi:MAG TPA: hypothetical protein VHO24_12140, partial [Opitutaceae bacterium]|nr:hypothetical protein [Opitutaceae bacterium]